MVTLPFTCSYLLMLIILSRPDRCDGTYDANCDSSRAYSNITAILNSFGATDLLSYMSTYWKDYKGDDESFWYHEWAKHGTCMTGERPASYFARSTRAYAALRYPDMGALSRRPLTADRFAQAMAAANPGLAADMMRVTATRQGWLDEVWLCMDARFRYRRCPAHAGGLPGSTPLKIWRGGR